MGFFSKNKDKNTSGLGGLFGEILQMQTEKALNMHKEDIPEGATKSFGQIPQIEWSVWNAQPKADTTNWMRTRVIIDNPCQFLVEVVDNGIVIGYLFDMLVNFGDINFTDGIHPLSSLSNVRKCYVPKSHIGSFGKYTPIHVLYNPMNPSEIVIDSKHEDWHYEM